MTGRSASASDRGGSRVHRLASGLPSIEQFSRSGLALPPVPRSLNDPWTLGGVAIPNRVVLAPLAGIGNWFVRLQARRHGAGLVVSEMVSSFGVHYGNPKTCNELLTIHPDEHPVSMQLFGQDPDVMRSAAATVAAAGADLIDLNICLLYTSPSPRDRS